MKAISKTREIKKGAKVCTVFHPNCELKVNDVTSTKSPVTTSAAPIQSTSFPLFGDVWVGSGGKIKYAPMRVKTERAREK